MPARDNRARGNAREQQQRKRGRDAPAGRAGKRRDRIVQMPGTDRDAERGGKPAAISASATA